MEKQTNKSSMTSCRSTQSHRKPEIHGLSVTVVRRHGSVAGAPELAFGGEAGGPGPEWVSVVGEGAVRMPRPLTCRLVSCCCWCAIVCFTSTLFMLCSMAYFFACGEGQNVRVPCIDPSQTHTFLCSVDLVQCN